MRKKAKKLDGKGSIVNDKMYEGHFCIREKGKEKEIPVKGEALLGGFSILGSFKRIHEDGFGAALLLEDSCRALGGKGGSVTGTPKCQLPQLWMPNSEKETLDLN